MSGLSVPTTVMGRTLFDYQVEALQKAAILTHPLRLCLYYRTGAGKTFTALLLAREEGVQHALVIAPPSTHASWHAEAAGLGMTVETISHAKFRQPKFKLARDVAVIADEFHLFGGHRGVGWKKLDRLGAGLQAPLILASATPNYNDAERVYCIQHVLAPQSCRGGYLAFLYQHCTTEANPFAMEPNVTGFIHYKDAAEYLAALPFVCYVPDETVFTIDEVYLNTTIHPWFEKYGLHPSKPRVMASIIEAKHVNIVERLTTDYSLAGILLSKPAGDALVQLVQPKKQLLVFAVHKDVAFAAANTLRANAIPVECITGDDSTQAKEATIGRFKNQEFQVLVGTATLATGTDGLDKICDDLVILDDTDDDALRRQLIGRILPRGADSDASQKKITRFNL